MTDSKTYIFGEQGNSSLNALLPFLQQRGIDPAYIAGLVNNNGGGFFGTNSAHPLENPTPFSNLVEMLSILLIPAALCFSFGRAVGSRRQGMTIFGAMFTLLVLGLGLIAFSEQAGTAQLAQNGAVLMEAGEMQPGGNMEGKETRFGIAAFNGSVNSMHDSYTPLAGMVTMLLMI